MNQKTIAVTGEIKLTEYVKELRKYRIMHTFYKSEVLGDMFYIKVTLRTTVDDEVFKNIQKEIEVTRNKEINKRIKQKRDEE